MLQCGEELDIWFECGQWITTTQEEESSNWRELANLVERLEAEERMDRLHDLEMFVFTDNQVSESAYCKGYSPSR